MREHYYFDNAATTWPKPEVVYQKMDRFLRRFGVNPGRGGHELAVEAERMISETRRLLAAFLGFSGSPQRVVFTQNVTDSLNIALFGLLRPGDHLITSRVEHNSVVRPANHLARDHGVEVTWLEADEQGYLDPDALRAALRPNTRMVTVTHASNVLGAVQDIDAIGAMVADTDAYFVVDTAQTAGVLDVDMERAHIDVLAFTGHKGLFGPMGIGGMIVAEGVAIRPHRFGGTGVDSIEPFQPENYPHRLEAGTVNVPGIAGLNAAQHWFAELGKAQRGVSDRSGHSHSEVTRFALAHIQAKELAHTRTLIECFGAMRGVTVYGPRPDRPRVATMAINIDGIPATQAGEMLDADHHVCVRAGLHCAPLVHEDRGTVAREGAIRIAPGYFTDDEDIRQLIAGVADIAGVPIA
ncbi:MAG: aminotransferase class V-fold PLP-dependent enzyme [Gammaproteobacteria bacterium]|nr:aminotransferase class V-fold PLP-dependent enzyme [Gammaproteobacteria bacterium]